MKLLILFCSLTVLIAGCNSIPTPKEPTGSWTPVSQRSQVKASSSMSAAHARTETVQRSAPAKNQPEPDKVYSMSLEQAIERYIPTTWHVEIDPDVDLKSEIDFDNSTNWLEALGQGMAEANMELLTNHYKKSLTIKRTKLSLAEAIDLLLPADYAVFTDAGINQNTLLHFDTRKYWVEALSNGMAETGIELTINFTKQMIYLTSASRDVSQSTAVID